MAIFDTIRESIGTAGQKTADIAKKTAEAIRLRDQIRRDKKEIRQLTYKIGETYLRLHGDQCEDVYKEFVDGITLAKADMEEKKDQLTQLRGKSDADVAEAEDVLDADDDDWDTFLEESTSENQPEAEEEVPSEEITVTAEEVTQEVETPEEEREEVEETAEESFDTVEE